MAFYKPSKDVQLPSSPPFITMGKIEISYHSNEQVVGKKSPSTSRSDASAPALGYLYQCRFALLLALRETDIDVLISIEKLDDIGFSTADPTGRLRPFDLRQLKHHINRRAGLGDTSTDIWKTLRIWADGVLAKRIDLDHVRLFMVTTSRTTQRHAIRHLRPERELRDPARAQDALEAAGNKSAAKTVQEAFAALMRLAKKTRRKLFEAIYLLDGAQDVFELRADIEREVRLVTDPAHRSAFVERLEGWWFSRVVEHLMDPASPGIFVGQVLDEVHELREQFRLDNLPDDFLSADVPASQKPDQDTRNFVKQLELIEVSEPRIRSAQEDHYKAFEQRSSWVRQHLIGMTDVEKFEARLSDEWKRRFNIMSEGLVNARDECQLVHSGQLLYEWVELTAPSDPCLFVRPEFRSKYMTRGSYHMLADKVRVGWHPEYDKRLPCGKDLDDAA